jgi:hypothetical protein
LALTGVRYPDWQLGAGMGVLGTFLIIVGAVPLAAMGTTSLLAGDDAHTPFPPVVFLTALGALLAGVVMATFAVRKALRRMAEDEAHKLAMTRQDPRLHHVEVRRVHE